MANENYLIFGIGLGADDLHYIGWTQKSLSKEEEICSDLAESSSYDMTRWIEAALHCGKISFFEIESVQSMKAAKNSATSLCLYFCSLGLDVITDES
jgi:hypothetical protein